jgi:hypothetical protein
MPKTPNRIHRVIAKWMARRQTASGSNRWRIVLTTNYDCLLERALQEISTDYAVLWYREQQRLSGDGEPIVEIAEFANGFVPKERTFSRRTLNAKDEFRDLLNRFPLIVKLHGSVSPPHSTFVITEAQYLHMSYNHAEEGSFLSPLYSAFSGARFVCIGYAMQDLHVRTYLFSRIVERPVELKKTPAPRAWILRKPGEANAEFTDAIWKDEFIAKTCPIQIVEQDMTDFVDWLTPVLDPPSATA